MPSWIFGNLHNFNLKNTPSSTSILIIFDLMRHVLPSLTSTCMQPWLDMTWAICMKATQACKNMGGPEESTTMITMLVMLYLVNIVTVKYYEFYWILWCIGHTHRSTASQTSVTSKGRHPRACCLSVGCAMCGNSARHHKAVLQRNWNINLSDLNEHHQGYNEHCALRMHRSPYINQMGKFKIIDTRSPQVAKGWKQDWTSCVDLSKASPPEKLRVRNLIFVSRGCRFKGRLRAHWMLQRR